MARFLAAIEGKSGNGVTRLGSADSGIRAQAQGWDVGVKVYGQEFTGDADVFYIYATGGSRAATSPKLIGKVRLVDGEPTFTPAVSS